MHTFILWCGVAGAWLLVAGAIYQASLELHKEQVADDRMAEVNASVPRPPSVSPWWWLLPPVRLYLDGQRRNRYRVAVLDSLTSDERATMVSFIDMGRGWFIVATGAFLIAMKETYELADHLELDVLVFWFAVVGLLALCVLNTVATLGRSRTARKAGRRRP